MEHLLQDLRFSCRSLLRSPGFTVVAVLTLGLAIGANTAIFSVVQQVLLQPLPYDEPERLVMVWGTQGEKGQDTVVPADFLDWRREAATFEDLAGYGLLSLNMAGQGRPERVEALSVTGNFFRTLGVPALRGYAFRPDDAQERDVVVLSHGLWQRRFNENPDVVGQSVTLNDRSYTIVGVMPPDFEFHQEADLWVRAPRDVPELPIDIGADPATMRGLSYMRSFGRLAEGVSLEQARSEMDAIARRQAEEYPKTNAQRGVLLVPLHEEIVGGTRTALLVLFGAVALVLLIACTNVASLLFARAVRRHREITVRVALGAHQGRLVRQLLTESLVLGLVSSAVGLLLAYWGVQALVAVSPGDIPRLGGIGLDPWVLGFTVGVGLLTGLVTGFLPLLQLRRVELATALREGSGRTTEGAGRRRLRSALVVAQVTVAVVLLVGAGLLIRSFIELRQVDPGFDPEGLLSFRVTLPISEYGDPAQQASFFQRLHHQLETLPGVESVGAVLSPPVTGESIHVSFAIEGRPPVESESKQRDGLQVVSPGYFETLGIPILRGRGFTAADSAGSARVAVISQAMADRYWGDRDPLGSRITFDDPDSPDARWTTIVGIAGNVRHEGPQQQARAETYLPFVQSPWPMMSFLLRTGGGDPSSLLPAIRDRVAQIDPDQPIADVQTMNELLESSMARPRFTAFLLGFFALTALILAAVGLYGVMVQSVALRTSEIGVRMALGAERRHVIGDVIRRGMILCLSGIALGLVGAFGLTRLLRALVYEVSVTDLGSFVAAPLVLLAVALLANWIPARRASRVDPVLALKHE